MGAAPAIFAPFEATLAAARVSLRPPIDWQAAFDDPEDRFSLHRFGWALRYFRQQPTPETARLLDAIVHDWIVRAPRPPGIGWDPYSISERIANWIDSYCDAGRFGIAADDRVRASIIAQAEILRELLECYGDDLTNNHLLNNARALYHAAQFAGRADLRVTAVTLLRRETDSHFTGHGLLNEGSSHYHSLLRSRYAGLLAHADRAGDAECTALLRPVVARLTMAEDRFFAGGRVLIGDVSPDSPPEPSASSVPDAAFSHDAEAGVARFRLDPVDLFLRVPTRAPRPRGHEHADLASFEMHWRDRAIFVDPGRSTYASSDLGRYARSARAHNTVLVNGLEPVTLARGIHLAAVDPEYLQTGAVIQPLTRPPGVRIRHHGYRRWRESVRVERTLAIDTNAVSIDDHVTGRGEASIEIFLHLHPDVACQAEGNDLLLRHGTLVLAVTVDGTHSSRSIYRATRGEQPGGWYFPAYGVEAPATTIALRWHGMLPFAHSLRVREVSG